MRIRMRDQRGCTPVEAVTSVIILSVALLALAGLGIISIQSTSLGGP